MIILRKQAIIWRFNTMVAAVLQTNTANLLVYFENSFEILNRSVVFFYQSYSTVAKKYKQVIQTEEYMAIEQT